MSINNNLIVLNGLSKLFGIVLLFCVLNLTNTSVLAQKPISWNLSSNDDLPSNIVYRVVQDSLGQMWIATDNGLVIYDGQNVIGKEIEKSKDHFIPHLYKDTWGSIWFANISGQIFVHVNGEVKEIDKIKPKANEKIMLFKIIEDRLIIYISRKESDKINSYKISKLGDLSDEQSFVLKNKSFTTVSVVDDFLNVVISNRSNSRLIKLNKFLKEINFGKLPFRSSNFYFNFNEKKIFYLAKEKLFYLTEEGKVLDEISFSKNINQFQIINDKNYILTNSGYHLIEIRDGKIYISKSKLSHLSINSIFFCSENLMWVSTQDEGIHVFQHLENKIFPIMNDQNKLSSVESIAEEDGVIYLGTNKGDVYSLDDDNLKFVVGKNSRIYNIELENGVIYYGNSDGVFSYNNGIETNVVVGLNSIKDFYIYNQDSIAVATGFNILKTKLPCNNTWTKDIFLRKRSYSVEFDKNQTIWLGTVEGLYFHDLESGVLTKSLETANLNISDIEFEDESITYVSTFGSGVFKFIDKKLSHKIQLPTERILDLDFDNGQLAVASSKGVFVIDLDTESFKTINKDNFLPTNSTSVVLLNDNNLWIGTDKGLCKINNSELKDEKGIKLNVLNFIIDGTNLNLTDANTVQKDFKNLEIKYQAFNFKNRNITYNYRLLGKDSVWKETTFTEFNTSALKPGSYVFEVKAMDSEGNRSSVKTVQFVIEKSLIDYLITKIILGFCFGGLIYWVTRSYTQRKEKQKLLLQQQQNEIDGMKMTALQNHMNPHFISNALYSIRDLIESKDNWEASDYTANFADLIRKSMRYATMERITLRQELEFLKVYLSMENTRLNNEIDTSIALTDDLKDNLDTILIPPLLIQPLIENSFKHGDLRSAEKPFLHIDMKIENSKIKCTVTDNGIGFVKEKQSKESKNNKSTGLDVVEQRLALSSKQLNRETSEKQLKIYRVSNDNNEPVTIAKLFIDIKMKDE